jgi:hypothetical protein
MHHRCRRGEIHRRSSVRRASMPAHGGHFRTKWSPVHTLQAGSGSPDELASGFCLVVSMGTVCGRLSLPYGQAASPNLVLDKCSGEEDVQRQSSAASAAVMHFPAMQRDGYRQGVDPLQGCPSARGATHTPMAFGCPSAPLQIPEAKQVIPFV